MKTYLEIQEQLTEAELQIKQPQIIRIEVKDKAEAAKKLAVYEPVFAKLKHIKQIHYCGHEDNVACRLETLTPTKEKPL